MNQGLRGVLATVAAEALDCKQANLAVLSDAAHGAGTHLRLGALLPSALPRGRQTPTVVASVDERLADAERLLGLRVEERQDGLSGAALGALVSDGHPWYVVADTMALPWTPYHGRQRMWHTFLLRAGGGRHEVVDAYHNDTPWGAARPGTWRLGTADLAAAVPEPSASALLVTAGPLPRFDEDRLLDDLAARLTAGDRAHLIDGYVASFREHPDVAAAFDRLTLETWLLARERLLHALWLERLAVPPAALAAASEHAEAWSGLARQVYLASRRVQRGSPAPRGVFESLAALLHADATLVSWRAVAGTSAATGTSGTAAVRAGVRAAIGAVLAIDTSELPGAQPLADIPGFNSFALAEVLERVERTLGVEVPMEDLTPASYRSVDSLVAVFTGLAVTGPPGGEGRP